MSMFFQNRVIRYFSSVAIANNFDVEIHVGKHQEVEVKCNDDILQKIITEVNSFGKLFIHMDDGLSPPSRPIIIIHTHILNSLYIRDNVHASVINLKGSHFLFEGTDSSEANLVGVLENFKVAAYGSTKLNALELEAKTVSVSCNHSSNINLFAHEAIIGDAYGNCNLHYKGNPSIQIFNSGLSNISSF